MLHVRNVFKSFDSFMAVSDAELKVNKGDLVAVIGPNGAGKTTLFNLITGQIMPDGGKIFFHDQDITRLPPYKICKRGIARSFQIANIFPRLSVFRNVQVAVLSQQGKSRRLFHRAGDLALGETNRILEDVGLTEEAENTAGSLSYGDQRILEIAVALGTRPELLVLDEPTAGMSPDETAKTMALIRKLADTRGLTILFCEHDMDVVFNVSTSIMVMHHGKTIIQGPPEEVRANQEVRDAYLGEG